MTFSTLLYCLATLSATGWAQYTLEDDYIAGGNFFDLFSFFDSADPTDGFVAYQSQAAAQSAGLISSSNTNVKLRVDSTNVTPNGRPSIRLSSNKSYQSGLFILDIDHMPGGVCGTWPAFWLVGPDWPNQGEIDIIEGVNDQSVNDMTLHTGDGCSITNNGAFSGTITTSNCYIDAAGQASNAGCQITTSNTQTYGSGFNANNGGVYATEWTSSAISVYFFPRGSVPSDIYAGNPNPSGWGTPVAQFQGGCDIGSTFQNQQITFDTTFCGQWAGSVWGDSAACSAKADTCNDFVQNNPSAFADAYWSINLLQVFSGNSNGPKVSVSANNGTSSASVPATSSHTTFARSSKPSYPAGNATSPLYPTGTSYATGGTQPVNTMSILPVSAPSSVSVASATTPAYSAPSSASAAPFTESDHPWPTGGWEHHHHHQPGNEGSNGGKHARHVAQHKRHGRRAS